MLQQDLLRLLTETLGRHRGLVVASNEVDCEFRSTPGVAGRKMPCVGRGDLRADGESEPGTLVLTCRPPPESLEQFRKGIRGDPGALVKDLKALGIDSHYYAAASRGWSSTRATLFMGIPLEPVEEEHCVGLS